MKRTNNTTHLVQMAEVFQDQKGVGEGVTIRQTYKTQKGCYLLKTFVKINGKRKRDMVLHNAI